MNIDKVYFIYVIFMYNESIKKNSKWATVIIRNIFLKQPLKFLKLFTTTLQGNYIIFTLLRVPETNLVKEPEVK